MARIELRDCTIYIHDGLTGNAIVSSNGTPNTGTTLNINTVVTNLTLNQTVPVGARFYVAGETINTIHTVNSVNTTTNVTD